MVAHSEKIAVDGRRMQQGKLLHKPESAGDPDIDREEWPLNEMSKELEKMNTMQCML